MVIDASLEGIDRVIRHRDGLDKCSSRRVSVQGLRAEVVIVVFNLRAPVWREHVLQTHAEGVAISPGVRSTIVDYAGSGDDDVGPIIGPSITAFRVKQHAVPSVANPAGSREYLVEIGAAIERRIRADRRPADARPIKVPFKAKYPAASRSLPIVAYDATSGGTGGIEAAG